MMEQIKATVLGDVLLTEFVLKDDAETRFKELLEFSELPPLVADKIFVCKLSIVLLVLLDAESGNSKIRKIIDRVEQCVFSPAPTQKEVLLLTHVQVAMGEINVLIKAFKQEGNTGKAPLGTVLRTV